LVIENWSLAIESRFPQPLNGHFQSHFQIFDGQFSMAIENAHSGRNFEHVRIAPRHPNLFLRGH
jgi:hypothetical protein